MSLHVKPDDPAVHHPEPVAKGLRSFWALNAVMAQGAFSDNAAKLLVTMMGLTYAQTSAPTPEAAEALAGRYTTIASAALVLPFIFVPSYAGALSDRFPKSQVTLWTKLLEVAIMLLAVAAFWTGSMPLAFVMLFLMGTQSALFSPAKYGILPELVPEERVGWANGVMQGMTFLAIIMGVGAGPWLFGQLKGDNGAPGSLWLAGVMLVVLALVGSAMSLAIAKTPVARPGARMALNPFPEIFGNIRLIWGHWGLRHAVIGLTVWWGVGAMVLAAVPLIAKTMLHFTENQISVATMMSSLGIGIGCMFAGLACRRQIEMGLVPLGALLTVATSAVAFWICSDLEFIRSGEWTWLWVPVGIGLFGMTMGLISVPLQAYVVQTPPDAQRGGVWAAQNMLTSAGMVAGSGVLTVLPMLGLKQTFVFAIAAVAILAAGIWLTMQVPRVGLRMMVWLLFLRFYRLRVKGLENVPKEGGALLTPNHQSFLDGILMVAALPRPVRFLMSEVYYSKWWIKPFAVWTGTIPISSSMSPREVIRSLRVAGEALRKGELVVIYPEGQITRIGALLEFRRGFERIVAGTGVPVIPVAIDNLWESNWSLKDGRMWRSLRLRLTRRPISVVFGRPLPDSVTAPELRQAVEECMREAWELRREETLPIHCAAVRALKSRRFEPLMVDPTVPKMVPSWRVLAGAIALGRVLAPHWKGQKFVGVLLPPGVGGTMVNLAALLCGRVPVNLNYTTSPELLEKTMGKAGITTVLTARQFLDRLAERVDLRPMLTGGSAKTLMIEDLRGGITGGARIAAMVKALCFPASWIEASMRGGEPAPTLDDPATVIFSSGSTGDPKGVVLSHWNIASNIQGISQGLPIQPGGTILGILPFFHSFGFTVTLWLPLLTGVRTAFHPNPLDVKAVGALVERERVDYLVATPTFLQGYLRRVDPGQFGSLRIIITGAEKLRTRLSDEFEQRFGIRPTEGYGATECSPVVAASTMDLRRPGFFQCGKKEGSIGRPLPGVATRIVDPATGDPVPVDTPGMLLVSGPNVMGGYLGDPKRTAEVLKDGWYITGDIVKKDAEGFLFITDRLSRFSKIGGEMVPHIKVEEALQEALGEPEVQFAVTGVPDEKKGERLVVLYATAEEKAKAALAKVAEGGTIPNLWMPKWADFIAVPAIPALGTGKLDLREVKAIASARATAQA